MTLIDRLRQATGPDRELDYLIAIAVDLHMPEVGMTAKQLLNVHDGDLKAFMAAGESGYSALKDCLPRFTASIDAALALVERMLPNCRGDVHWGGSDAMASILRPDGKRPYCGGATPALAILGALFLAIEGEKV